MYAKERVEQWKLSLEADEELKDADGAGSSSASAKEREKELKAAKELKEQLRKRLEIEAKILEDVRPADVFDEASNAAEKRKAKLDKEIKARQKRLPRDKVCEQLSPGTYRLPLRCTALHELLTRSSPALEITVSKLRTLAIGAELDVHEDGLVVRSLTEGGAGQLAGLHVGDIIHSVSLPKKSRTAKEKTPLEMMKLLAPADFCLVDFFDQAARSGEITLAPSATASLEDLTNAFIRHCERENLDLGKDALTNATPVNHISAHYRERLFEDCGLKVAEVVLKPTEALLTDFDADAKTKLDDVAYLRKRRHDLDEEDEAKLEELRRKEKREKEGSDELTRLRAQSTDLRTKKNERQRNDKDFKDALDDKRVMVKEKEKELRNKKQRIELAGSTRAKEQLEYNVLEEQLRELKDEQREIEMASMTSVRELVEKELKKKRKQLSGQTVWIVHGVRVGEQNYSVDHRSILKRKELRRVDDADDQAEPAGEEKPGEAEEEKHEESGASSSSAPPVSQEAAAHAAREASKKREAAKGSQASGIDERMRSAAVSGMRDTWSSLANASSVRDVASGLASGVAGLALGGASLAVGAAKGAISAASFGASVLMNAQEVLDARKQQQKEREKRQKEKLDARIAAERQELLLEIHRPSLLQLAAERENLAAMDQLQQVISASGSLDVEPAMLSAAFDRAMRTGSEQALKILDQLCTFCAPSELCAWMMGTRTKEQIARAFQRWQKAELNAHTGLVEVLRELDITVDLKGQIPDLRSADELEQHIDGGERVRLALVGHHSRGYSLRGRLHIAQ